MRKDSIGWHAILSSVLFSGFLFSCGGGESGSQDQSVKFQQYYVQGEQLYVTHCSNCHQKDGSGLGLLYPPVNQSDFIDENRTRVICLMREGIRGEIMVNGSSFIMPMEGISSLTDLEIAEIATYLYNTWGREDGLIDVTAATQMLSDCD